MSRWFLGSIISGIATIWERALAADQFAQNTSVRYHDINAVLDNTHQTLTISKNLLEDHRDVLPPEQFASLQAQRWRYSMTHYIQGSELDRLYDPEKPCNHTDAQMATDRAELHEQARDLLIQARILRDHVLDAIKRTIAERIAYLDEQFEEFQPVSTANEPPAAVTSSKLPRHESSRAQAAWPLMKLFDLSRVLSPLANGFYMQRATQRASSALVTLPAGHPAFRNQDFAVRIAHVPVSVERDLYERILYITKGDHIIRIVDPELHPLEATQMQSNEHTLAALCPLLIAKILDPSAIDKTTEELRMEID